MMLYTYQQLAPFLHRWAFHFQNRKYDHWELVNSAWLSRRVQKLKNLLFASASIKYAMIEYMRSEEKSRVHTKQRPQFISLPDDIGLLKVTNNREINDYKVETVDFFDWLTRGFSKTDRLIIKRLYIDGWSRADCARELMLSQVWLSLIHKSLLKRMKEKLGGNGKE